ETYAEAEVFIYSRTGQLIFQSKGYNKRWNGTFNNQPLPVGTYYYIIDLKNNIPKISGSVTIIR
ncbi:T9SS type B sorting domain-containing protein, partial [Thermococcus sp. M36]|uniref:T9SS type B sorting domain-containing protein n=1 Tax=Thermococcus sp. M36 TaxID=1638261 RepID=UPI00143C361D